MKKILLILLCLPMIGFGQDSEIKMPLQGVQQQEFSCFDGENRVVAVNFLYLVSDEALRLSDENFKQSIISIMNKSKAMCNYKLTFTPKVLAYVAVTGSKEIKASLIAHSSNAYGVRDEFKSFFTINKDGLVSQYYLD